MYVRVGLVSPRNLQSKQLGLLPSLGFWLYAWAPGQVAISGIVSLEHLGEPSRAGGKESKSYRFFWGEGPMGIILEVFMMIIYDYDSILCLFNMIL